MSGVDRGVRVVVAGDATGNVRRIILYLVVMVGLLGTIVFPPFALLGGVALLLLAVSDKS